MTSLSLSEKISIAFHFSDFYIYDFYQVNLNVYFYEVAQRTGPPYIAADSKKL